MILSANQKRAIKISTNQTLEKQEQLTTIGLSRYGIGLLGRADFLEGPKASERENGDRERSTAEEKWKQEKLGKPSIIEVRQ